MKLEHKIGIAITCTFLCLVGAVLGLKMQEQPAAESPKVAATEIPAEEKQKKTDPNTTSLQRKSDLSYPPAPPGNAHSDTPPLVPPQKNAVQSVGTREPPTAPLPLQPPALDKPGTASAGDDKLKMDKVDKSAGASSAAVKSSTSLISGPTLFNSNGPISTGSQPNTKVASPPVQPPTSGAIQWNPSPAAGSDAGKNKPQPPFSLNDNEAKAKVEPTPSKPSEDPKQAQPANNSSAGTIAQTSGKDSFMPIGPLPPPAAAPAPSSLPLTGAAPSAAKTTPSVTGDVPTRNVETRGLDSMPLDPKAAGMSSPLSPASTAKSPETSVSPSPIIPLPTSTTTMPAPAAPSTALPTPSPAPPLSGSPTSPPALAPAPLPAAMPPSPPKPPGDGSSFVPDSHPVPLPASGPLSGAPAPLGAMPAPIPLPTAPASVPLGSGSGQPSASASAPAPRRPTGNAAQVTVYDEQEYVCKPGDTFASISQRYLLTDKYAKALQRHNQNHARASVQMANGGTLTPGEKIYIPQAYVLEQRYADAIPNAATPPSSPIVPTSSVAPSGSPPAAPPSSPPPAPAPSPTTNGRPPSPPF